MPLRRAHLTERIDLRTGRSPWLDPAPRRPRLARLPRRLRTEVLIIGAGISGVLVAHALAERGHEVTLIDRRMPLTGSTAASTALLQFEIDTPLIHLARRLGVRRAGRAWLRSKAALDALSATIHRAGLGATVATRASLYLAGDVLDARGLAAEAAARARLGLPSRWLGRRELQRLHGLRRAAAIHSEGNLAAQPLALAMGMLRRCLARGVRIHAPHEARELAASRRNVQVATADGAEIEARHVIFCTGYELPAILRDLDGHRIVSTWALATCPQPARLWPGSPLIWEAADPYLYVRSTPDGRVICGGADEPLRNAVLRDRMTPRKTAMLQLALGRLLPQLDTTAEYRWAGSFGQSDSGLPRIGAIPGHPRCHAVLGFGGNGITWSMMAAEMLTAAVAGIHDPDAALFAFP